MPKNTLYSLASIFERILLAEAHILLASCCLFISCECMFIVFWFSTANLLYFCQKLVEVVKIKYFCSINGKLKLFGYPYTMRRKDMETEKERYFHYTFYLIFRILSTYIVLTEMQQSEGRADCIVETKNGVYIFEFKLDGSADEALLQIEEKGYARPYEADKRKIHKVGVSFSSKTGTIDDWKEA